MWVIRTAMLTVAVAGIVTVAAACGESGHPAPTAVGGPTMAAATAVTPDPRVGALFLGGGSVHTCSAAVLHSSSRDLVLTAAHCLVDGIDTTFVPGFHDDTDGAWHIAAVYLDPRWLTDQDPQADFAIVRATRDDGRTVEDAAGGGLALGSAPAAGTAVTVTGYRMGEGGDALACRGVVATSPAGFPSLACAGLSNGFSGAPWVVGSTVTGLVGGPDGGGCDDDVSYSPRFGDEVTRLLARAEVGGEGDSAPIALGSIC